MMKELTYATVCSGIECMSVAARGLPLRPVFFSEIEPFPYAVLKARYPDVPNPATCPDSPRYKACGNGWATNQPRWIICRLLCADGIDPFNQHQQKENTQCAYT